MPVSIVFEPSGSEIQFRLIGRGFIKVNEKFETSRPDIFAIGDVIGPPLLAHAASQEGIIAVLNIAGKEAPPFNPHTVPRVNYCHPQVASIGLTGEEAGFVKIVADKKYGEVLGVHMIGPDVSEFIGGLSLAVS